MKVYVDKLRFFNNFQITSNSDVNEADIMFIECGKIIDVYIKRIDNPPKLIYCITDAIKIPAIRHPQYKIVVPSYRYKQLLRIYDVVPPPVPQGNPEPFRKLFLFVLDNYYFDMYALSAFKQSKYFHMFTISNSTEAFRKHMFCIYTNMSVASDDLLLLEAMANGCVPITHRNVPGIHFKMTGRKIMHTINMNVYLLDTPDLQSFNEAIETALHMKREEYEDLQAKVREFVGDTKYEERVETIRDLIRMFENWT
ncbi:putative glycosyltransferase [Sulfolobales Beppu filamentous virus 2]|uniref:Putative glycosyltransferase n=1 Tax=Sulfolobales Beppu filamentous virus 2 TaxID=2493123 RepID=A0A3Q8Q9R7_9VIRU|nr:putative glycosyltransferase [Sulfolobales Beppu filamentous virus 2]AZI75784.1 putative glycosyltransferase [Sulfolobales Beppu filamentous virus 2]